MQHSMRELAEHSRLLVTQRESTLARHCSTSRRLVCLWVRQPVSTSMCSRAWSSSCTLSPTRRVRRALQFAGSCGMTSAPVSSNAVAYETPAKRNWLCLSGEALKSTARSCVRWTSTPGGNGMRARQEARARGSRWSTRARALRRDRSWRSGCPRHFSPPRRPPRRTTRRSDASR